MWSDVLLIRISDMNFSSVFSSYFFITVTVIVTVTSIPEKLQQQPAQFLWIYVAMVLLHNADLIVGDAHHFNGKKILKWRLRTVKQLEGDKSSKSMFAPSGVTTEKHNSLILFSKKRKTKFVFRYDW